VKTQIHITHIGRKENSKGPGPQILKKNQNGNNARRKKSPTKSFTWEREVYAVRERCDGPWENHRRSTTTKRDDG